MARILAGVPRTGSKHVARLKPENRSGPRTTSHETLPLKDLTASYHDQAMRKTVQKRGRLAWFFSHKKEAFSCRQHSEQKQGLSNQKLTAIKVRSQKKKKKSQQSG